MISSRELKRRFLIEERQRLEHRRQTARKILEDVLYNSFDRRLYRLKPEDEWRLLVLFNWREQYDVSISWMLKRLLEIWPRKFAKYKTNITIGCSVPVLIGQKSEEIIREMIDKEFRSQENAVESRARYRHRIEKRIAVLAGKKPVEKTTQYRSVLDAPSPDEFFRFYGRELRRWKRSESLTDEGSRQMAILKSQPFRGNPYR